MTMPNSNSVVNESVDRATFENLYAGLEVPTPFVVAFQRGGDKAAYAAAYTGFVRAISEPVVRAALHQPEGQAVTVESLYEHIQARLLVEPERYLRRYTLVAALLTRR
jgi:hypothetical protein